MSVAFQNDINSPLELQSSRRLFQYPHIIPRANQFPIYESHLTGNCISSQQPSSPSYPPNCFGSPPVHTLWISNPSLLHKRRSVDPLSHLKAPLSREMHCICSQAKWQPNHHRYSSSAYNCEIAHPPSLRRLSHAQLISDKPPNQSQRNSTEICAIRHFGGIGNIHQEERLSNWADGWKN